MENFSFYSPTYFEFGKDAELKAGELVKQFGGTKVLLHFGGQSARKSGLLDRVEKALSDAGKTNVAYKVLLNEEKPGWLYEVLQDSSTVWEYLKVQIDDYIMGIC